MADPARFIMTPSSHTQAAGNAHVTAHYVDEERIAFGRPNGQAMTDEPEHQAGDPVRPKN